MVITQNCVVTSKMDSLLLLDIGLGFLGTTKPDLAIAD